MEIVYCDVCGHRIPDADFNSGSAVRTEDKAICAKCPKPEAARVPATATAPVASRETVLHRPVPTTARRTTSSIPKLAPTVRTHVAAEVKAEPPSSRSNVGLIAAAAGAVVVLGLIGLFTMSGSPAPSTRKDEKTPSSSSNDSSKSGVATPAPEVSRSTPATQGASGKLDPEREASLALEKVLKFEGVQKDDYKEKVLRLEEFIDKYSDSKAATAAQRNLRELREQAVNNTGRAVELPPIAENPKPDPKVEPTPQPANTPPPPQPAQPAPVAAANLPPPPVMNAAGTWKIDLSAPLDGQGSIAMGSLARAGDANVLKAVPTGSEDFAKYIEFEAQRAGTLFTVTENAHVTFSYFVTAGTSVRCQIWARDGDKFANFGSVFENVKANEWTTVTRRFAGNFKNKNGEGDPIKPGSGARNIQFYGVQGAGELYVCNVLITDGPPPDNAIAKPANNAPAVGNARYDAFARSFFDLLVKRDEAAAREALKKAEEDAELKSLVANERVALEWYKEIEAAQFTGAKKLKDGNTHFELRTRAGQTHRMGKDTKGQITAIAADSVTIAASGETATVAFNTLDNSSRYRLANQGLEWDVKALVTRNFMNFLRAFSTVDEVTIEQVRAGIQKGRKDGLPAANCDYLEKLLSILEKDCVETQAAHLYHELLLLRDNKAPAKTIKTAAAAWQKRFAATKIAAAKSEDLKALANAVDTPAGVAALPSTLNDGLAGHWKFDDGAGSKSAADASGKGNAGKPGAGGSFAAGIIGGAYSFDGGVGFMEVPGVTTGGDAFSVSCWVRHNSITAKQERYLTFGDECAVLKHEGNGQLAFSIKTDSAKVLQAKGALSAQKWTLITGTWDGTTQKLYQDGKLVQEQVPGGSVKAPTNLKLGGFVIQGFAGLLDDVRIYSRALTQEEVAALTAAGAKK
ncbi:MAG TPA: LamG domain-containing protein [Planctomycetota bacterium]|nr:LamG domain-containing protein [Planctomycetota bacterium]